MIKAIAERPWIWLIVAYAAMTAMMITFIVICETHPQKEIPTPPAKIDY